ncbi:MAG: Flp pilus assembly protein CpaB [Thermoguttaceae bacterium]|nr:Flp pilus assembly protein CpaB [Thermoguttaceae bacterium]
MNWKTWSLLLVALLAGLAAAYVIKGIFFVERDVVQNANKTEFCVKEQLLVANGDLPAGTELSALNVRLALTPEEEIPRDGIFSFRGVAGRRIIRDVRDGEAITLYDLQELEQQTESTTAFVPPGCSLVPIEIVSATKENGNRNYLKTAKLNQMVKTGDAVDLLVIKDDSSRADASVLPRLTTEILASNVSVLSVTDENRFGTEGLVRSSVITMLLRSEDLERVRKAYEEGKIRVELHRETEKTELESASMFSNTSLDADVVDEMKSNLTKNADSFVIGLGRGSTSFEPDKDTDVETLDSQNATNSFPANEDAQVDATPISAPSVGDNSDFAVDLENLSEDEPAQKEDVSDKSNSSVLDLELQSHVGESLNPEIMEEAVLPEPPNRVLDIDAQGFRSRPQTTAGFQNMEQNKMEETSRQISDVNSSTPQFEDVATFRVPGAVREENQSMSKNFKKQSPFVTVSDKRTQK